MDAEVGAVELFFLVEADADQFLDRAIDDEAAGEGDADAEQCADELRHEADATDAAQCFGAEDTRCDAAPRATQAVQRPHAEHVVDLPAILREGEHDDEQGTGDAADDECADGMEDIRSGADGNQSGQRAVVHEAGVVLAQP